MAGGNRIQRSAPGMREMGAGLPADYRAVIERLAADIQQVFPGLKGFSRQNIWRMRAFHVAWSGPRPILAQPVRELAEGEPPLLLLEIPWGHNILLMQQLKDSAASCC